MLYLFQRFVCRNFCDEKLIVMTQTSCLPWSNAKKREPLLYCSGSDSLIMFQLGLFCTSVIFTFPTQVMFAFEFLYSSKYHCLFNEVCYGRSYGLAVITERYKNKISYAGFPYDFISQMNVLCKVAALVNFIEQNNI